MPGRISARLVVHLLEGQAVELALGVRRPAAAAEEGAGEIGVVAEAADHVGIEGDQVAVADRAAPGLLEPWVGARPGAEQAGLDVVAVLLDHAFVEQRPELVLADPGAQRVQHAGDRLLGRGEGGADAADLLGQLDRAGALDRILRVEEREALRGQGGRRGVVDPLEGDPPVAAALRPDQVADLGRPAPRLVLDAGAGGGERHRRRRADLVDRREPPREMMAARELEQHHRPFSRDEQVARRIAGMEHLHVARAGGVADVDRIDQHAGRQIALLQLRAHPPQARALQTLKIDLGRPVHAPVPPHRLSASSSSARSR